MSSLPPPLPTIPLVRQASNDFVLQSSQGPLVSNNRSSGDFVLVHESPVTKRRELRASKELTSSDRAALKSLDSSDFVLVHESPTTSRRELRASRELTATDREALETLAPAIAEDEDEVGATVQPSPYKEMTRTASYKNGRRVDGGKTAVTGEPHSPSGVDTFFQDLLKPLQDV